MSRVGRISNEKGKEERTITEWKISFQIKVNKQIRNTMKKQKFSVNENEDH